MPFKQPRSVQIVIFAERSADSGGREYLLLSRVGSHVGFWQTVTGSLEGGETHRQAAVREVREETGIACTEEDLIDLCLTNVFEIAAEWLPKYAPGVTHNEERCFALRVEDCTVRLDPREHDAYRWLSYEAARETLYWESSRKALDLAAAR